MQGAVTCEFEIWIVRRNSKFKYTTEVILLIVIQLEIMQEQNSKFEMEFEIWNARYWNLRIRNLKCEAEFELNSELNLIDSRLIGIEFDWFGIEFEFGIEFKICMRKKLNSEFEIWNARRWNLRNTKFGRHIEPWECYLIIRGFVGAASSLLGMLINFAQYKFSGEILPLLN